jgi:hypothetical protein
MNVNAMIFSMGTREVFDNLWPKGFASEDMDRFVHNTHTYIHTYLHTYIHTHIHTHIHAYTHIYMPTHIYTYIYIYICTCMHTYPCV